MIDLLFRAGSPAATSLRPEAPPVLAPASERGAAPSAQESISLDPGKPVERELSGGQSHFYKITMTSGQYLRITVSQRGIDALVALFTPDGKKIGEVDGEQMTVGSETISAIAEAAGAYGIEVRSIEKMAQTGRYEIKIEELRDATTEDKYRVAAESLYREAELLSQGTLEERRKSIEKYQEALELYQRAGASREEAATLNGIGVVYGSLGEMWKALEKYNEALPIRRATGDRRGETDTLNNIGAVYQSLGEMQKALEKFNEALPIARAIGYRSGEADTLNNIGIAHRSLGEMQKSLEKFNEALLLLRAIGDRSVEAFTLNNIGTVYNSLGETQRAVERFNQALSIFRLVSDRSGESTTLLWIARVEQKLGNLPQARQVIEQAVGLIESLRANIASQELRASYFASQQDIFETYIDVLMQAHKQDPAAAFDAVALAVTERARARSLLELLTEARADIRQGVDSSLLERERSLRQRLNARAAAQVSLLNRKHTPEQADAAAKEIAAITDEYEEIQARIRARSPRYAALTQPQPLNLKEIQQQALDEDTLLLEYALGEKRSYLWLVSQHSIDSYELPPRAELEAATRRVYELLTARPKPWTPPGPQFIAQAKALSRMLLGPVAPQLGGKRLVVVAPGALSYLPFAALPAPEDKKRQAGDYKPLIAEHEVVSIPSASVLSIIRRETAGRSGRPNRSPSWPTPSLKRKTRAWMRLKTETPQERGRPHGRLMRSIQS
jgi:tetratricopeptide (TPR) repeat protein